jgi:hypothetical protein
MTEQDANQGPPATRPHKPIPPTTWLLLGLIVLFFALGLLLVTTGTLTLGGDVDLPGPTAFTLTP